MIHIKSSSYKTKQTGYANYLQSITSTSVFLKLTLIFYAVIGKFLALMGIPGAEEIFDLYSKEMELEYVPNWQFYMAFCFFRQAAILQTNYKTSLKGKK